MSCEATRSSLRDAGWTCDGEGLIVLFRVAGGSLKGVPVVVPMRLADRAMRNPATAKISSSEPFTGGATTCTR